MYCGDVREINMFDYLLLSSESDDSDSEFTYLCASLAVNSKREKWQCYYLRRRGTCGEFHTLFGDLDNEQFKNYFRMSREQFDYLHDLVKDDISGTDTNFRRAIGSKEKLAMSLR
jgi:hypothetical protein